MKNKLLTILAILSLPGFLFAGSSASSVVGIEKYGELAIAEFATKVEQALDERQVNVAIMARAGRYQEDLPKGVEYTHCGIAVFEAVRSPEGKISYVYTVYNLYQGAGGRKNRSHLVQDFVYDMCAGIAEPKIGIIIPNEKIQREMLKVLRSPFYSELHNENYNLIANPYNDDFDNCVSHTLEVVVAAKLQTTNAQEVNNTIQDTYDAHIMKLSLFQEIGIGFMEGATLDDQASNNIYTATFGSVRDYMREQGIVEDFIEITM